MFASFNYAAVADLKRGGGYITVIINLQWDSLARYLTQSKSQSHRGPKIFVKSVISFHSVILHIG